MFVRETFGTGYLVYVKLPDRIRPLAVLSSKQEDAIYFGRVVSKPEAETHLKYLEKYFSQLPPPSSFTAGIV